MASKFRFYLFLLFSIFLTACSSQTEHKIAKFCCGRVFDTTIKGVYQSDDLNGKVSLSHGILFKGLAVTETLSAYEYEIHGDVIEFWSVVLMDGDLHRTNPGNVVRRSWYFFGFEPMEYLSVGFLPMFNFGFEDAPSFTMKMNNDKSLFSLTESRLTHCRFFRFGSNPVSKCEKDKTDAISVWRKI